MTNKTEFKPFNTRRLQIFELSHFMATEHMAVFDGNGYTSSDAQFTFAQAVELFNNREDKDIGCYNVDSVKLSYHKKAKKIVCTNHLVKLTTPLLTLAEDFGEEPIEVLRDVQRAMRLR